MIEPRNASSDDLNVGDPTITRSSKHARDFPKFSPVIKPSSNDSDNINVSPYLL